MENMSEKMRMCLPRGVVTLLKRVGCISNEKGYRVFVVGGIVRDLLLGVKNLDIDIVVEGDAIRLAGILSRELGGTVLAHPKFGTASLFMRDGLKVDLATARTEVYAHSAALPTVRSGALRDDFARRDFTINAMAFSLNEEDFGALIDFFDGRLDLSRGRIRALHDGSFIDDPTRIFRAMRFAQRFGFSIDHHTEELMKDAIAKGMIERTSRSRIREELILMLKEPDPFKALARMDGLHPLAFLHPRIAVTKGTARFSRSIAQVLRWYGRIARGPDAWLLYMMALLDQLTVGEVSDFCAAYAFSNHDTTRLVSFKRYEARAVRLLEGKAPVVSLSRLYELLGSVPLEALLAIMAKLKGERGKKRMREFITRARICRLRITGDDLKALGLAPGPAFKAILGKVLRRRLDGGLKTRRDELAYARRLIASVKR